MRSSHSSVRRYRAVATASLAMCLLTALGCQEAGSYGNGNGQKGRVITVSVDDEDVQTKVQEALINAEPHDVIEFGEGKFDFTATLSLEDVERVTIRGKGIDKTILNFGDLKAGTGGEGILVKADHFTIEDLSVEDTPADGIKVEGATHPTFRRVKTTWTRGPDPNNGAYGIYPVLCENVLVEECVAECAADAGIYVGQTKNTIVRGCRAERNVAGIEIENTIGADVYDNVATNNTGGLLVFSLPGLKVKNGRDCRVHNNTIVGNNHDNFAKEGNIVATIPPGSGVIIMANENVEVFNNEIRDNKTLNCSIVSYGINGKKYDDPEYDPHPEGIWIHHNTFENGGSDPAGTIGKLLASVLEGKQLPDILYDGSRDEDKLVDGELPPEYRIYVENNGDASFMMIKLASALGGGEPEVVEDLSQFSGSLPNPPGEITIEDAE